MEIDALCAQLEELFELEDLKALSQTLLEIEPEDVGGATGTGSFARSLTKYCARRGQIQALAEAVIVSKPTSRAALATVAAEGIHTPALVAGATFGAFTIQTQLGNGPSGSSYEAKRGDELFRLKILHACDGVGAAHSRFLVRTRWLAAQDLANVSSHSESGNLDGRGYVASPFVEGSPLSKRLESGEGLSIEETQSLTRSLLEALATLHDAGVAHGNLKPSNILLTDEAGDAVSIRLQDLGAETISPLQSEIPLTLRNPENSAPEVIRGSGATIQGDIYAVGAIVYQMLTGRLPFSGKSELQQLTSHLQETADTPSSHAPVGRVNDELDIYVLRLLSKDENERPAGAAEALRAFERLSARMSQRPPMPEEHLEGLIKALVEEPTKAEAAVALEAAIEEGAPQKRVARSLDLAFVRLGDDEDVKSAKLNLGFRAGRLYRGIDDLEAAESIYAKLVTLQPGDPVATTALEDVRVQLGQSEELIESWLATAESADSAVDRAAAWLKIGRLCTGALQDSAQAIIAFTQAFCETAEPSIASMLEELAKDNAETWSEILDTCSQATTQELAIEQKSALLVQLGQWYTVQLKRPDVALQCYNALLLAEPANEAGLRGLAEIFRKAQQWPELVQMLLRRADAAATPAEARELRFEAGQLQATKLSDPASARQLLQRVLEQDPTHDKSNEAMGKILRDAGDFQGYAGLLETWASASDDGERLSLLCRAGGTYEAHLGAPNDAMALYKTVISEDPTHMGALRGLDRLYAVLGQYDDLLANLQDQLEAAATPRQKLELYERIAGLYEEEFLSPAQAVEAYESMLQLDPAHDNAMVGLARGYKRLEQWEQLAELYEQHAKSITEPERRVALLLLRGATCEEQLQQPEQAIAAYEAVVELDPEHTDALEALVRLRQSAGDAAEALQAIDQLTERAATPEAKRDGLVRAGQVLRERGDWAGAISRYEAALALFPEDSSLNEAIGELYLASGDMGKASELLKRKLEAAQSSEERAKLAGQLAALAMDELNDDELALSSASAALESNTDELEALRVLATVHTRAKRVDEATPFIERLLPRLSELSTDSALQLLSAHVKSLAGGSSPELALSHLATLLQLAPENLELAVLAAEITFDYGDPAAATTRLAQLIENFDGQLTTHQEATANYRYGEAIRRTGDVARAIPLLEEAADLAPESVEPVQSLIQCYEEQENWEQVWTLRNQVLDLCPADERGTLLSEMGEFAASKLNDRSRATKSYVAALESAPDDRKLLTRLMQLYSADKDWAKLVDVVAKLADFQEDPKQKAKYLMTAGMVNARELGLFEAAISCFEKVTELDPSIEKATTESIEIHRELGNHEAAERLLRQRAKDASQAKDNETLLSTLLELASLFAETERLSDQADALDAALKVAPDNREVLSDLTELYRQNADRYFDRAVALQTNILQDDPYRADAYKALRKLYTKTKSADGAWCLCQGLYVLNLAEPDEEKFFARMRATEAAYAQSSLTTEAWSTLTHDNAEPRLTRLFALIEPAVIAGMGRSLTELGYDPTLRLDLAHHQYPIGRTLFYASGVLAVAAPQSFENANDPGGITNLGASPPAISIGTKFLTSNINAQALAFIAGRHLAYHRPGFFIRELLGKTTHLKNWLFAAIKSVSPNFPIAPEMKSSVERAMTVLNQSLELGAQDELTSVVENLLQDAGALDLKKWATAVDFTADRAGFLLAHDLERSVEMIRNGVDVPLTPIPQRTKELVQFAISPAYLELRRALGISLQ